MKLTYRIVLSCIAFCLVLMFFAQRRMDFGIEGGVNKIIRMPGGRMEWENIVRGGQGEIVGRGYLFVHQGLVQIIKDSAKEGGRLILEHDTHGEENVGIGQVKSILSPQITIKGDNSMGVKYTHAKVFVWDNQALFQTFNLTKSSIDKNREFAYMTQDPLIVKSLHELFQADWNGRPLKANQIASGLVVCPQNCYKTIVGLLSGATHSIDIYNQYISYEPIVRLLHHSPVKKRVLLPNTSENKTQRSGSNYVRLLKEPYIHAKIILIDKKILLLSSINLSENSIRNNREIGLIITDSGAVAQMVNWFDQDRKKVESEKRR